MNKPTGNVTFLFTDIEGSTRLAQEFPDSLSGALEKHHAIMHKATASNNGFVFEIVGDAFCCAFQNAKDAVKAAVDAQINLANEKWDDVKIKIRIGINTGNVEWNGKRYMGYITLARTARVMSAAYGEQIIISNDAYELCFPKLGFGKESNVPNHEIGNEGTREISFRDLGERRLKDLKQPVKLYQVLAYGLREDFPPLKTLDARPNNLPVQLTSFIGREAEMKLVKDLLKQTHLLTLTGSGGAGKTRFALQVAADLIDDYENGVWFVELASLFEPAFLPQAIMKVFSIKEEPKRSPEDTLCDYLRDKEMLIILDNCEHLVEPCAKLTEKLLSSSPKLKILATSREGLRCAGEQAHRTLSLEVPDPKDENSPDQLSQYEAVRLFIERALAVDETFRVNNNNAPALAEICYQLDGIPLAIELAAARTKSLSVEQIYERLNDRFNLLTGGKRTAAPRQHTLRALIDWSYDLLSENEQILWGRLSVFSGGWTLESAEEVCSNEEIRKEEVLELLDQLIEKSIIFFEKEKERYGMLETIRQYGNEKLKDINEAEEVLSKHLHYFMQFSETTEHKLQGSEIQIWLEKLELDHDNFQSAISWSLSGGENEIGTRLAGALGGFWYIRGLYSTGKRLLDNLIVHGASKSSLGKAMYINAMLTFNLGQYESAWKLYEECLAIYRETGDKRGIAISLHGLGSVAYGKGNYEQTQKFYEESLELVRDTGDKKGISIPLTNLGILAYERGNYEQAQKFYEESLALNIDIGSKEGISNNLINLGLVSINRGNYEQGQKFFEEALALNREMGYKRDIALSLSNLGLTAYILGNFEVAQKFYEESLELFYDLGYKLGRAKSLFGLGNIAHSRGNLDRAQKFYVENLSIMSELCDKRGIAESLIGFATILNTENHKDIAVILLGAVDSALISLDAVLERDIQKLQVQIINILHEKLSEDEFSKYFEEGKKLTLEQAAELALSVLNDQMSKLF